MIMLLNPLRKKIPLNIINELFQSYFDIHFRRHLISTGGSMNILDIEDSTVKYLI